MGNLCRWMIIILLVGVSIASSADQDAIFYESFNRSWVGLWTVTKNNDYKGRWKYEKSSGHEDYGLVVSEKAKKYGIVTDLPHIVDPNDGVLTLQFDVRFQNGLECSGAYLKFLLPKEDESITNEINNNSPYSFMFGPDKCGPTNKVHFIYRHRHPYTQEIVEHHMKHPALPTLDKYSHVYTATIFPDNMIKILVDGELAKSVNMMLSDFEPPLIPPKMIPDSTDIKPSTWDERRKIIDPEASKPADWNEDEPQEIVDTEAVKPDGWLEDELEEINDPDSIKPQDWDDQEDGIWEPEMIDNPKCKNAPGCGEWKPPMKANPAYVGKWKAPLIDNPDYSGVWQPKQISNPEYYEIARPHFEPIGRIGIEIWTMDDGIVFDNILMTNNVTFAEIIREKTWRPKFDVETRAKPAEEAEGSLQSIWKGPSSIKEKMFERIYRGVDQFINHLSILEPYRYKIVSMIKSVEDNSTLTMGILGTIPLFIVSYLYSLTFMKRDSLKFQHNTKQVNSSNIHDKKIFQSLIKDLPARYTKSEHDNMDHLHKLEKTSNGGVTPIPKTRADL